MRFSEIELQCDDIMWFGMDRNGYIFECTSGGCGVVPEFVCCSKEETDTLYDYFMEELEKSTDYNLLVEDNGYPLSEDGKVLAEKGIFCFDVDEGNNDEYKKISYPSVPLSAEQLPENIRILMQTHIIDIDVYSNMHFCIEHTS